MKTSQTIYDQVQKMIHYNYLNNKLFQGTSI